jgi:hypothetical protein
LRVFARFDGGDSAAPVASCRRFKRYVEEKDQ